MQSRLGAGRWHKAPLLAEEQLASDLIAVGRGRVRFLPWSDTWYTGHTPRQASGSHKVGSRGERETEGTHRTGGGDTWEELE